MALTLTSPELSAALAAALRSASGGAAAADGTLAVAVSGGADSAMLAVHAAALCAQATHARPLRVFHIHHGLQPEADAWAEQVRELADVLGVPADVVRVCVERHSRLGPEAAARHARYAALAELARQHRVATVLLAHHRDDQAETVLLRLLRGTGPAGMAGMAAASTTSSGRRPASAGSTHLVRYLRPWLGIDRALIVAHAQRWGEATGWQPVADPSNHEARYARGALRSLLAPVLDTRWPGWRARLARHAEQAREAQALLTELAQADFATLAPTPEARSFSLAAWRQLAPAHQTLVLRYWLAQQGSPMPTEAKLTELTRQLRQLHALGHDRQLCMQHGAAWIRCVRGRVVWDGG